MEIKSLVVRYLNIALQGRFEFCITAIEKKICLFSLALKFRVLKVNFLVFMGNFERNS